MPMKKPRILLIGAGRFGIKHLETLIGLGEKGVLVVAGVVVRTVTEEQRLKKKYRLPIYHALDPPLLDGVDAVDIATPPNTHFSLVSQCLPRVNVFVEKPLASTVHETAMLKKRAAESPHILMVGHIFRFNPTIIRLRKLLRSIKERPSSVQIEFINPAATDTGRDVELEMLHPFDMLDYVFDAMPTRKNVDDKGRMHVVSLVYKRGIHALLKIGWSGKEKKRIVTLQFPSKTMVCDLEKNAIHIYKNGSVAERIDCSDPMSPLEAELRTFVRAMRSKKVEYPDADVGHRIVRVATMGRKSVSGAPTKRKVAIIGGGIFGTNCAIELAPYCDVTIFEKNGDIFSEASKINQYRHHWGYHYPRSQKTVDDIFSAINEFEQRYAKAIIRKFPTYYSVAKKGSKVGADAYLNFCDRNNLPYVIEYPSENFLNREKTDVCIKTFEPIYDYKKLKRITEQLLKRSKATLRRNTEVLDARILPSGQKVIRVRKDGAVHEEQFDSVINATYARYNNFCKWLGFPRKPLRLDLVEVLWVKLNIPRISLAVMDGKFTNIVPTHDDGVFTLVHIKESVLRRFVPKDGLVPKNIFLSAKRSRAKKIIDRSMEWFPFLKNLKLLRIHYVLRGVNAYREHDDARTSDVTEHGFGCFSILGGKIINSVSVAKEITRLIT
ncbi:FAD-dependent oxidoreductase [Candidatus Parcubacteria bacterium]|nr:MAG: FAD-dependent oxidoreductase [Candidatus Parcubacteria bacterium]